MCSSFNDKWGVTVKDSIDLQLKNLTIYMPIENPSLDIDNTGISHQGNIILDNVSIDSRCDFEDAGDCSDDREAMKLNNVDAEINSLFLASDVCGFYWKAKGDMTSYINNSWI
jgi:hypothetical protein